MKKLLSGLLILTMLLSMMVFSPAAMAEEDAIVMRMVVASEVHTQDGSDVNIARLPKIFQTAYAYSDNHAEYNTIDAFLFNGDSIDHGKLAEWKTFQAGVDANLRPEESQYLLTLAVTHDLYNANGTSRDYTEEDFTAVTGKDFGNYVQYINGIPLVTLSNDDIPVVGGSYDYNAEWLDAELAKLAAEDAERPILVAYHYSDMGTLAGAMRWDMGDLKHVLDQYPQAIVFNGHVHWDPRLPGSIWQETYTAIYDGASAYTAYPVSATGSTSDYDTASYAVVEVTESGAVSVRYIDPDTGELLNKGNGTDEPLIYTIERAWDPSTWRYTDAQKNETDLALFAEDAAIALENGSTLTFDAAACALPMISYKVTVAGSDGSTQTYNIPSDFQEETLPGRYTAALTGLEKDVTYTATVVGLDSLYRETANTLTLTFDTQSGDQKSEAGLITPAEGDITIANAEEMIDLLQSIAGGETYAGENVILTADIDLENALLPYGGTFKGTLDGNGFTVNHAFTAGSGLFAAAEGATFRNINLCGTVAAKGNAGALVGTAVKCSFLHCMIGSAVVSIGGTANGFAAAATDCSFTNCFFDGTLKGNTANELAPGCTGTAKTVTIAAYEARAEGKQVIYTTAVGSTVLRTLADPSRKSFAVAETGDVLNTAEDLIYYLLNGGTKAVTLGANIDLTALNGRMAAIAANLPEVPVSINGDHHVIIGGSGTLSGTLSNLGCTDLIAIGTNCWDADDFTAEQLKSGEAAYTLKTWAQNGDLPNGEGIVVKVTYDYPHADDIFYVNAGTKMEVEVPYGYTADTAAIEPTQDTTVTFTAHAADKTALGAAYEKYGQLKAGSFNEAETYTAAVAAAKQVLDDAAADDVAVSAAVTALETAVKALTLNTGATYENYPAFKDCEVYAALFGSVTKWSINDRADLDALAAWSKEKTGNGMEFHMTADIDMEYKSFAMIGSADVNFRGTFDGHLHTVSNLAIEAGHWGGAGFFVQTYANTIRNFGIESGYIRGAVSYDKYNGGDGNFAVGGVVGVAKTTTLNHVWNKATVSLKLDQSPWPQVCVGGLTGRSTGGTKMIGCYNAGDVYGSGRAAGFSNWSQSTTNAARIINCFNVGTIRTANDTVTEAIARYGKATSYNDYALFNNYYLDGSAACGTSASAAAYDIWSYSIGAEAPKALSAEEINTQLAALLNAGRDQTPYADTAVWVQGEDGYPVIAALDDTVTSKVVSISSFEAYPDAATYTVSTPAELNTLATLSKENSFAGKTILLMADLDMSETENFTMIGNKTYKFAGTFDGQGHTIRNLAMSNTDGTISIGLIQCLAGGTVKNLTVDTATITGVSDVGVVVGIMSGNALVENVHSKNATLTTSGSGLDFGGIVGTGVEKASTTNGTIRNCSTDNFVISTSRQGVGGIIGRPDNMTIDHCIVTNSTFTSGRSTGFIAGFIQNGNVIKNCITYGNTLKMNFNTFGSVGRHQAGSNTIENVVIYEATADYRNEKTSGAYTTVDLPILGTIDDNATVKNCYSTSATVTSGVTNTTVTELDSGKIAYDLGWAMKDGYIAFTDADTLAAKRYTYVAEGQESMIRYTDGNGDVINAPAAPTAPEGETFLGWVAAADPAGKEGDRILTAEFGTEDNGTYSITEFENRPLAKTFTVSTEEELNTLAALSATNTFEGLTILLAADIDMSSTENFAMIGNVTYPFKGTFNGQGHTVSGLKVTVASGSGMFNYLTNATVKNFTLDGADFTGTTKTSNVGLLAGNVTASTISNVHVTGSSYENTYNGGSSMFGSSLFAGKVYAGDTTTISNCSASGNTVTGKWMQGFGCFAGYGADLTIQHCYVINNELNIRFNAGAFIGYSVKDTAVKIDDCFSYGNSIVSLDGAAKDTPKRAAAIGNIQSGCAVTIKNSVFTDDYVLVGCSVASPVLEGNVFTVNAYTNDGATPPVALDTPATVITAAQITSGEIAHTMGWALEDGKLAFPDADTLAARKYTYMVDGQVYTARYTDSTGKRIGIVADPAKADHNFTGWTQTADGDKGDQLFAATFELKPAYTYLVDGQTYATLYGNSIDEITPPADPTKPGYLFAQWIASGDGMVFTAEFEQNWSVNGDLKVDLSDVILLLRYLVGHDEEIDLACADVNKDGKVSILDAVKLLKYYTAL